MIELAILGCLKESTRHGYELKKHLREILGPLSRVSFGSLYPALGRLERSGAVRVVEAGGMSSPIPMTGSLTGEAAAFRRARLRGPRGPRNRKVYSITPAGEERLVALLADPSDDDRSFSLKLAFCRWSDPDARVALLERRRATLEQRLAETRRAIEARRARVDRYLHSLMEHDTDSTQRDIAWLDHLIATERSSHRNTRDATTGGPRP